MQIERLKITEFRNLKDFEILFTRTGTAPEDSFTQPLEFKSHAIIGQNATGKSNAERFEYRRSGFRPVRIETALSPETQPE